MPCQWRQILRELAEGTGLVHGTKDNCVPLAILGERRADLAMASGTRQDYTQFAQAKRRQERERAYEESLAEDMGREFVLPRDHRPTENLITEDLQQASVDTQLSSSNVGYRLLQKMGWKGKGLGKDEQGITEPIKPGLRDAKLGVGKQEEDDFYTAEANIHRKKLEVELETTEELVKRREVEAEREQKIQTEVKEIRKVFFCELCNKQYKLAMEFEHHLSSYDHNHKKRFKEMKESQASRSKDERQKREQAREEKEMARFSQIMEARRQQQQDCHDVASPNVPGSVSVALGSVALGSHEQRTALKFGFGSGSKPATSKLTFGSAPKKVKAKLKVPVVFQDDSENDS